MISLMPQIRACLFLLIGVQREEVLVDEIFPEGDLGTGKVIDFASPKGLAILDPEGVDQVVPV